MIYKLPRDKDNPFTNISHYVLRDNTLSPDARLLMTYLTGQHETWKATFNDMLDFLGTSEYKARKAVKELVDRGHLVMRVERGEDKRRNEFVYYDVYEVPQNHQLVDSEDVDHEQVDIHHIIKNNSLKKEQKEREIYEYPADLLCLQFYETQIGESVEPFVDQLRDEIKRLGEKRVVAKAKACKNGESWQYLLKSLAKLNENETELDNQARNIVQVGQWQPSGYAHNDDAAESFVLERFDEDDYGDTIDLNATIVLPVQVPSEIQEAFDRAKQQLALQFDDGTYIYFMRDMQVRDYSPATSTITIEAPNERTQQYTRNIRRVISDVLNQTVDLVFTSGSRDSRLPIYEGLKTGQVAACPA